ncbi:Plasmid stabilization protein ParE [Komagataeibacter xylinus]
MCVQSSVTQQNSGETLRFVDMSPFWSKAFISLVEGHSAFKDMSTLCPGLRMVQVDHHYIFCLPREGAPALVVAILHERMDLLTRLAGRL